MLLWSLDGNLWTAFESFARTAFLLQCAEVLQPEGAEMGSGWPMTEVRTRSTTGSKLINLVAGTLEQPDKGGEDERFKRDLNKLDELLSMHEHFFVASAGSRSLLSTEDAVFKWNDDQKKKLKQLQELLHPKYFSAGQEIPVTARVVQVIMYANTIRIDVSDLERRVLWRATHLFPVLAFCEIMVACEGNFGAAVAAKSALELVAHFVTGGKAKGEEEGKFDPLSDASKCIYSDLTKKIDKEELYDRLCKVVKLRQDSDDKTIKELCNEVFDVVVNCKEFKKSVEVAPNEELLVRPFPLDEFPRPAKEFGNFCLVTWRDDFDAGIWPGGRNSVDTAMSWSGVSSPRLTQLGFDEVWAYDSPATIEAGTLLTFLREQLETKRDTDKQRCYRAIDSLLRTTCIARNLNNNIAIGAIVRELHLNLEKLIHLEKPEREDLNELDILEDDLDNELNHFRMTVHAALSSFAHPGWLIRTDLLRVHKKSVCEALLLTADYSPRIYGRVVPEDGNRTLVRHVDVPGFRPMQESHWRILGERYPEAIRESLRRGRETVQTGEGFTVPFEAFELCRRALEKLL